MIPKPAKPAVKSQDAITAKLEALKHSNAQAAKDLAANFPSERWAAIIQQCESHGMDAAQIESLAGKMVSTRQHWHPGNAAAAMQAACNGFLCAIGSAPTAADEAAYEAALKPL